MRVGFHRTVASCVEINSNRGRISSWLSSAEPVRMLTMWYFFCLTSQGSSASTGLGAL